jgi:small subunit ribosomal protein S9
VARVRLRPAKGGEGKVILVGAIGTEKSVEVYFAEERDRNDAVAPLKLAGVLGKFDVRAKLHGGGFMGQAGAMRLAVARALRDYDPALDKMFRDEGYLTRDAREVERKKYGQAGARRRFQFSKR